VLRAVLAEDPRGAGFEGFDAIRLDEMGMEKGRTPPAEAAVDIVVEGASRVLSGAETET
jgi:hypothetical protein